MVLSKQLLAGVCSMGACCSSGTRRDSLDRAKVTIMPAPPDNGAAADRPRSGLAKLQTFRYQVHTRSPLLVAQQASNASAPETETLLAGGEQTVDENVNNNSPILNRSSSNLSQRSNASSERSLPASATNTSLSMNRFGFGFKRSSKTDNKNADRSSKDSGKGSVESLDNRKQVTTSSSTSSLSKFQKPKSDKTSSKLTTSKSMSESPKSGHSSPANRSVQTIGKTNSTSAITTTNTTSTTTTVASATGAAGAVSKLQTLSSGGGLRWPGFRASSSTATSALARQTDAEKNVVAQKADSPPEKESQPSAINKDAEISLGAKNELTDSTETESASVDKTDLLQGAKTDIPDSGNLNIGYRSSRMGAQARGPYLARLQATSSYKHSTSTSEPYPTANASVSKTAHKYQKNGESKFGLRTTAVPNQLSFTKRVPNVESRNRNTPDSMTESVFNPEAPLATFDSLGSTAFMSQISVGSDDLMLDFDDLEEEKLPGFCSVASTPGDEKSVEQQFSEEFSSSSLPKRRSKSIEAPRKRSHGTSPLVIDSTKGSEDSAYISVLCEDMTLASLAGPLDQAFTSAFALDDLDKTLSCNSASSIPTLMEEMTPFESSSLLASRPTTLDELSADLAELDSEMGELAGSLPDTQELRIKYRAKGRAATLHELTELMQEVNPNREGLTRTRSLSSPLRPPRPRSMTAMDDEETVAMDGLTYRQTMQEITTLKTLLHKLKRGLHEDDVSLLDADNLRRGMRGGSFGSEGSLLDSSESGLKRRSSQRSNPDTSAPARNASLTMDDVVDENSALRQQIAALQRDLEEKDHTIHLLQQQMIKYNKMYDAHDMKTYHTAAAQTEGESIIAADDKSKLARPKTSKLSTLPPPKPTTTLPQSLVTG